MKKNGAPVDIALGSPVWVQVRPILFSANSQRQSAAQLFLEWFLSKETAEFVANEEGRSPARSDVKSPIAYSGQFGHPFRIIPATSSVDCGRGIGAKRRWSFSLSLAF
jgi:ABC-type Fe3+ transport system substrate-binding protein